MQVNVRNGKAIVKLLQKEHDTLAAATEIAETLASLTHDAAEPAKQVLDGLQKIAALVPRKEAANPAA